MSQDSYEEDTPTHTLTIAPLVVDRGLMKAYLWLANSVNIICITKVSGMGCSIGLQSSSMCHT